MSGGTPNGRVKEGQAAGEARGRSRDSHMEAGRFFCQPHVFDALQNVVIPEILSHSTGGETVRAWVADCGAGEDAYAIAMLLGEAAGRMSVPADIQVFATDPDRAALAAARAGRYPATIARDISPARLGRWFVRDGSQYCVTKELRETCIFSAQDITRGMPFSRMDLISGRRVLNDVSSYLQDGVVLLFNFSLRPGGFLVASPGAELRPELFEPVAGASCIFRRLHAPKRILPLPRRAVLLEDALRPQGYVDSIESELRSTKEELRWAIERLEIANRDLQGSNAGFRALNRELEFSKEELSAANKELQTVNGALNDRIGELAKTNSDLKNFLDSSQVATVFLDRDLRVMKFTAAAADVLGFSSSDLGRPVGEIESGLVYADLRADAGDILRTLGRLERQLQDAKTGSRFLLRMMPYRTIDNAIAGVVLTFLDVTAAVRAEERFQMMAVTVPAALFTADADLTWDYVNPPFHEWTGLREGAALGEGWMAAVHPDDLPDVQQQLAECRQSGRIFEHEFRMCDASKGYRWYLARATAMRSPAGNVTRWTGSLVDIHERRMAEARQRLLFAELQHRVKNVLGVVRSIVGQTVETSASLDEFATHFDGRLNALARTQTSLARHGNRGVDLEELIAEEVLSHIPADDKQIRISGPSVRIGDRAAEALGLAIHELATNAVKYGAFANPSGRVSVNWTLSQADGERRLHLEWSEDVVPVIDPNPKRVGFGREFLERGLAFELGADTALAFRPGGLRFVLDAALDGVWSKGLDERRAP